MFKQKIRWCFMGGSIHELNSSLPLNKVVVKRIGSSHVGFLRTAEKIHAFQGTCPHQGAFLAGGWESEGKVVCPLHRYHFDLETGRGGGLCVRIYFLEEKDDGLYLGIPYSSFLGLT